MTRGPSDFSIDPDIRIARTLAQNLGNVTQTAKSLGISRQHLQTLIKKYGITRLTDTAE